MPTDYQKQIHSLLGQSDDDLLSAEQAAGRWATVALVELLELAITVKFGAVEFGGVNLSSLFTRFGRRQIINDDGLWQTAKITDPVEFDNRLGNAAAALFLAAQARGWKLNSMARERAEILAARRANENHS